MIPNAPEPEFCPYCGSERVFLTDTSVTVTEGPSIPDMKCTVGNAAYICRKCEEGFVQYTIADAEAYL